MAKIAVLAFSGGLDTSYCAKYYSKEKGYNVHSVIINTGGFSPEELANIETKAKNLGVSKHVCIDISQEYYKKCIRYMIFGNILKNNTYPLSVSSERIFQAIALAQYARDVKADYIIHGSTGAGNDQVRFDLAFNVICPEIEILTPVRDEKLTREYEIEYLKKEGIVSDWKKQNTLLIKVSGEQVSAAKKHFIQTRRFQNRLILHNWKTPTLAPSNWNSTKAN